MTPTDQILFNAVTAMAGATDEIVPGAGNAYRRFADNNYRQLCQTCRGKGQYAGLDITCRACHGSGLEPIDEAVLEQAMADTKHLDDVTQEFRREAK